MHVLNFFCKVLSRGATFDRTSPTRSVTSACELSFAKLIVKALVEHGSHMLSECGPRSMLQLQTAVFVDLCLESGALSGRCKHLALWNMEKSKATPEYYVVAMLDLAELLNFQAYMRTYVSSRDAH
eukprot:2055452-Amphidinium_carterae.1